MPDNDKPIIDPCPCGRTSSIETGTDLASDRKWYHVRCDDLDCWHGPHKYDRKSAIAAYNQHCEYVEAGKLVGKFLEKPPDAERDSWAETENEYALFTAGVRACLDFFKVESGE